MRRIHRHRPAGALRAYGRLERAKPVLAIVIVAVVLLWIGSWLLKVFDFGATQQYAGVSALPESRSSIRVSLEGGEWKTSDGEVKLYPGDSVETPEGDHAVLKFFDGSMIRMNENTSVRIIESTRSDQESQWSAHMDRGSVWVAVSSPASFSGAIKRYLSTENFGADMPSSTRAVVTESSVTMIDGDGIGAVVGLLNSNASLIVGEGQTFALPGEPIADDQDLYAFRKALDSASLATPFVEESKTLTLSAFEAQNQASSESQSDTNVTLTVLEPADETRTQSATIDVRGSVTGPVESVRINGYAAQLNTTAGTFSLTLALPDEDRVRIVAEAVSTQGEVAATQQRTVIRDRAKPASPQFLTPAKTGETYSTDREQFEITGTAPAGAVGIIVNDYRLQFFSPGDTTWKYLANAKLGNVKQGVNEFKAVAVNAAGFESEPAVMTIILGDETGLVQGSSSSTSSASASSVAAADLPQNDPLSPGGIRILGPTAGDRHTATGSEVLIEGGAPEGTVSVWVNDYRLRLYNTERRYWNYRADLALGTLKRGRNAYEIVARDAEDQILDRATYVITYNP